MNLIQLTPEQRLDAHNRAQQYIIKLLGNQPTPEQFKNYSVSKYPAWVTRMIAVMLAITAIASALPSLFRLFTAGRDYFLLGINEPIQGAIVGIATFMLAEFLVILATISANVLYTGRLRWLFAIPVVMGLSMAVVGNVTIVKPHDLFSWLEALVPVGAVLFIAVIGERLTLESITNRHSATIAYETALAEYQKMTQSVESHPKWIQAHAESIKHEIVAVNSRGSGSTQRREYMASLQPAEWKKLVMAELQMDEWFTTPTPRNEVIPDQPIPFGHTVHTVDGHQPILIGVNNSEHGYIKNGKMTN